MLEYFQILANSWPLTIMFVAAVVGSLLFYLIRWCKTSDHEDKAYRASQAVVVRNRGDE